MTPLPCWLVEQSDVFLFTTYGVIEKVNTDDSVMIAFTRHGFTSRRYLSTAEVRAALEFFDLRPRYGRALATKEDVMPFVNEMGSQRTLKVADLAIGPNGSYVEKTLKIAGVNEEVVNDETGEKGWVMRFQGARKGLKLNATNLDWGAAHLGQHTDQWAGRPVTLYVDPTVKFGEHRGGLRLKVPPSASSPAPPPAQPAPPPIDATTAGDFDDDIPF